MNRVFEFWITVNSYQRFNTYTQKCIINYNGKFFDEFLFR